MDSYFVLFSYPGEPGTSKQTDHADNTQETDPEPSQFTDIHGISKPTESSTQMPQNNITEAMDTHTEESSRDPKHSAACSEGIP